MRWNRLRGPWICFLDAFYYHSDGLERPSITSGRVGEFLVCYRPLSTRRLTRQDSVFELVLPSQLLAHLSFRAALRGCKLVGRAYTQPAHSFIDYTPRGGHEHVHRGVLPSRSQFEALQH